MAKDLTESLNDRQKAEQHLALSGVQFNGDGVFTKQQGMIGSVTAMGQK
ncbi:hypothetical protein H5A40_06240 [Pectobacterium brasiliense]|nr:hypothetical protein [Pectobacterium brasiliense]QSD36723.1 hypothetical protein H5A40_06240 [Pectobacterium brasiliense]